MTWMGRWKFCFYNQRARAHVRYLCNTATGMFLPVSAVLCTVTLQFRKLFMQWETCPHLSSCCNHSYHPFFHRTRDSSIPESELSNRHSTMTLGPRGMWLTYTSHFCLMITGPKPLISLVIDEGKGWRKGEKTCMRLQKLMGRSWGDGTVALPEDWGSILGTHMREITTISNTNA